MKEQSQRKRLGPAHPSKGCGMAPMPTKREVARFMRQIDSIADDCDRTLDRIDRILDRNERRMARYAN